jgi:hypothetical protein
MSATQSAPALFDAVSADTVDAPALPARTVMADRRQVDLTIVDDIASIAEEWTAFK